MAENHHHHNDPEKGMNGNAAAHATHDSEDYGNEAALNKIRTAGSISISPEMFEKMYLSPQNKVKGTLPSFSSLSPIHVCFHCCPLPALETL